MFKITKWHALIGAIILLFSSVIVEAGNGRKRKALQVTNVKPAKNASMDAEGMTVQEKRKAVQILDQQAPRWNYKGFNWADLHPYFSQYIGFTDFLYATKDEEYSSIVALAQKLSENLHMQTVAEAKFFVYSALNALYLACIESSCRYIAELLKQVNEVMRWYTPDNIIYARDELMQGEIENVLTRYENKFVSNSSITKVSLNNPLSNLIRAINRSAGIHQPCKVASIPAVKVNERSTVEEIMQYYPNEKERVFVFLVRSFAGTTVTETTDGYNPMAMKPEPRLRKYFSKAFTGLWQSDLPVEERVDLARIAILGFGFNPLTGMLSDMPEPVQLVKIQTKPSINWAPKALEVLNSFRVDLTRSIPTKPGSIIGSLWAEDIITSGFKDTLEALPTKAQKNAELLDKISTDLGAGVTTSFEALLKAMEKNDDIVAQTLAQRMRHQYDNTSCQMPEPVVPGATNVPQPIEAQGGGTTASSAQKSLKVLKSFYEDLASSLPIDGLVISLYANDVITTEFKAILHSLPTQRQRASTFLDQIVGELESGCTKNFESFLEAMQQNDNLLTREFAQRINKKLAQE